MAAFSDPAVWIHLLASNDVEAQAAAVQKCRQAGECLPLYGLPFAVKDNIDVAGCPTTAACPAYAYVAKRSAPVVQRLLDAGAILVGKTNLDQFATGLAGDRSPYGACRNVFDPAYISGGSSSGSAVAVGAGLVSFALGTDTAGSGRVPAGCCDVVGLKPTWVCSAPRASFRRLGRSIAFPFWPSPWKTPPRCLPLPPGKLRCRSARRARLATFAVPRNEDLEFCGDAPRAALFQEALIAGA